MHQQYIRIPVFPELQRLAGSDCDHVNRHVKLRFELRQEDPQEAGVLGAGGRGQAQVPRGAAAGQTRQQGKAEQGLEQWGKSAPGSTPARPSDIVKR
jgi:hypothetical protein